MPKLTNTVGKLLDKARADAASKATQLRGELIQKLADAREEVDVYEALAEAGGVDERDFLLSLLRHEVLSLRLQLLDAKSK